MRAVLGITLALVWMAAPVQGHAEDRDPFDPVLSMGLPVRCAPYAGLAYVSDRLDTGSGSHAQFFFGCQRDIKQPAIGALGAGLEGYAGPDVYGARALLSIRALRLKTGLDFSTRESGGEWVLTFDDPIFRGGFGLRGSTARFEWIPARRHVGLGLSVPLFQPWVGRTRPREIHVNLSDLPEDARRPYHPVDVHPDSPLRDSAEWIDFLTTPHDPQQLRKNDEWMRFVAGVRTKIQTHDADHPDGRNLSQEITTYHRRLGELFESPRTCDAARRILFERLVAPFDAEFGRVRGDEVFAGLCASARQGFADWCDTSGVPSRTAALAAFDQVLVVLIGVEKESHRRWDDTRKIWLSLDLVLRPDEHDSQQEVDAILERIVGEPFQGGNAYEYLVNEAFSPALIRSIRQASRYHVLWIHDFPGAHKGRVDSVGCAVVTAGYLSALESAVRRLDEGKPLPTYIVLLDQWYFDGRKSRWWMSLLRDPLDDSPRLPRSAVRERALVLAAQSRLRAAVDSSHTLARLRAERGDGWLHRFVRVNVNVTFPGDPTFLERTTPSFVLKFSDDYMRDHSKLVFWDLSEESPVMGGALITGEGVGENYEGSSWEDRTLFLQGPSALVLKRKARELFLSQGFRESEIALPLVERPRSSRWDAEVDSLVRAGNTARVLQAFNGTGYQRKSASAAKAALYNLMPAGSRLFVPDSQWTSYFWAGMLAGAALRGLNVFVVAAKPENAPYDSAKVQSVLTHDVLEAYVQLRDAFAPEFAAAGGSLNVGIYGEGIGTRSLVSRYRSVTEGMQRPGFPRTAFPFSKETYSAFADTARLIRLMQPLLASPLSVPAGPGAHEHPKLHLKTQFFGSGPGLARALGGAPWDSVFSLYVAQRIRATREDPSQAATGSMSPSLLAPIHSVIFDAPPESLAADVFYFTIGSHNQNDRSLLLDGEVLCLVAGPEALAPVVDFAAIAARSEWIQTTGDLDRAIPRHSRCDVKWARHWRSVF